MPKGHMISLFSPTLKLYITKLFFPENLLLFFSISHHFANHHYATKCAMCFRANDFLGGKSDQLVRIVMHFVIYFTFVAVK